MLYNDQLYIFIALFNWAILQEFVSKSVSQSSLAKDSLVAVHCDVPCHS